MTTIKGKRILLGLSGGIAAYKAAELTRLLKQAGAEVRVVMTAAACRFITPVTLQALSGKQVHSDLWDASVPSNMAHIELSRGCDAIVIAPASADFLAKLAQGLCDDLLSALCLARECPLLVAPAMNLQMWANPATQRNVKQLHADGVAILGPASGDQACGEVGMGRMLEAQELLEEIEAFFQPKLLAGKRVLITAGPTFEPIDTVRGITNTSSGKMGYAVARAARDAGATVTLVSGPTALAAPRGLERVDVSSAQEMYDAVMVRVAKADVFIGVAAVADYRPKKAMRHKLKKGTDEMTLELQPNPDILGTVAARRKAPFCVGFAAETENLEAFAEAKRRRKKVPLLAANLAQHAFGADDNQLILFDDQGRHELPRAPKIELARALVGHIARLLPKK
ncbi:MAG: bifunctional phosphopantothenoylcysteine decarboxylase/phosphopantothenate--cysteine ligase CoaBC [Betaproteobacteria bacterium]|nr:MAG: bifunctional phosphopantothenoylcysteine decarboxylase/phosphopantothenate--cysteine ligase CoaBC [Betaproteobacteria bacterium]